MDLSQTKENERIRSCIDNIVMCTNPIYMDKTISFLGTANYKLRAFYLQIHDEPLVEMNDTEADKFFIACPYNQENNSFRSPWSGKYYPEQAKEYYMPPDKTREEEIQANTVFEKYVKQYYGNATSSVYYWIASGYKFQAAFLVHKSIYLCFKFLIETDLGCWDSIHICERLPDKIGKENIYESSSSVILTIHKENSNFDYNIYYHKHTKSNYPVEKSALSCFGEMIEIAENNIRSQIDGVYFSRTHSFLTKLHKQPKKKKIPVGGVSMFGMMGGGMGGGAPSGLAELLAARRNKNG